jgi:hypothetical protein
MAVDTAAILAVFRVVAPEFSATSDATVNALSAIEGTKVSATAFGANTSEAVAHRVAHLLEIQARLAAETASARGPGVTTSVSTGDLSISRSLSITAATAGDAWWMQTAHGLAYLALRDEQGEIGYCWAG